MDRRKRTANVSIIIPVRTITPYVRETVFHLQKQSETDFEIIIVTDKAEKLWGAKIYASGEPTPAYKRNLGASRAEGEILAFLDDDSYPEKGWLAGALKIFNEDQNICAVCGPTLTPSSDNIFQKASGEVWASWFGSKGAGVYRNRIMPRREVDDFPSVNLLVRKADFMKVGGFNTSHWPGEDTKLCLDLVNLGKKIIYDPSVLVFHHRRPILFPHLKQIERYALRRGYFARVYPETSFRIGYFLPSFFSYGLVVGGVFSFFSAVIRFVFFLMIGVYGLLLLFSGIEVYFRTKSSVLSVLTLFSIFATHIWYGFLLPIGYFGRSIKTIPHKLDREKKMYLGG